MDACFASASVLVTFGVVLGKVSPLQLLAITLIQVPFYVLNSYIGWELIWAVDAGTINDCIHWLISIRQDTHGYPGRVTAIRLCDIAHKNYQ
jgi:hypothetical protein